LIFSVEQVQNLVPQIDSLISKLGENSKLIVQIGEDLTREIELLRENIKLARGEAGRVRTLYLLIVCKKFT
jgi:hypothetical protein